MSETSSATDGRPAAADAVHSAAVEPTIPPRRGRDHRVDLVRGLALVSIFINHMPGNWLSDWTSRNFGFSDAAEMFVLLAGFAAAMAYGRYAQMRDYAGLLGKALRRAGTLYAAHLLTTTGAIALFVAVIRATGETVDLVGVAPVLEKPADSILALIVGGFQLSYFNILPMYVVLIALLPGMLLLAGCDMRLLAAASAALYLLAQFTGAHLPAMGDFDSWYFNPIAWQSLFAIGLVVGLRVARGHGIAYNVFAYALSSAYVLFALGWRVLAPDLDVGEGVLPYWIGSLQKPNLPVARFLHVLALAYVVGHSRVWSWAARVPSTNIVTRLGRNSLPVFMLGSMLSMAGWLTATITHAGMAGQTAIVAAGVAAMSLLALWLEGELASSRFAPRFAMPRAAMAYVTRRR